MANVVTVDQKGNFVVVVHLPGGFLFSGDDAGCYHPLPVPWVPLGTGEPLSFTQRRRQLAILFPTLLYCAFAQPSLFVGLRPD